MFSYNNIIILCNKIKGHTWPQHLHRDYTYEHLYPDVHTRIKNIHLLDTVGHPTKFLLYRARNRDVDDEARRDQQEKYLQVY